MREKDEKKGENERQADGRTDRTGRGMGEKKKQRREEKKEMTMEEDDGGEKE